MIYKHILQITFLNKSELYPAQNYCNVTVTV